MDRLLGLVRRKSTKRRMWIGNCLSLYVPLYFTSISTPCFFNQRHSDVALLLHARVYRDSLPTSSHSQFLPHCRHKDSLP